MTFCEYTNLYDVKFTKNIWDSKCCISCTLQKIKTTFFLSSKRHVDILLYFSNIYNQKTTNIARQAAKS